MGKLYMLFNPVINEITAYFPNKTLYKQFKHQRENGDEELIFKSFYKEDLTDTQIKQLEERHIEEIDGILLTRIEVEMFEENKSYMPTDLLYRINNFLKLMQYIKFTDEELIILERFLLIVRAKIELTESDENFDKDYPEQLFDDAAIILNTFKNIMR